MTEFASPAMPDRAAPRALRRAVRPWRAVAALALVGTGLVQTWTGLDALGSVARPVSFALPAGPHVQLSAAQALLGLAACASGLSAGAGRRWGVLAGLVIAATGCGIALAAQVGRTAVG